LTATIHILLWVTACLAAAPLWVLSAQCLLGLLPARRSGDENQDTPTLAVLVPAHNEEAVIVTTLDSLHRALPESGRIVVVADNCTDRTAQVARGHGAHVVERHDTVNRGKGFALAAGLASLQDGPPKVVIIVDADCTVTPAALTDLAQAAQTTGRPVQGVYLLSPPDTRDTRAVVSAFAFLVKNQARPRGMDRLGLPVPLTGSGMAFPYALLKEADLATGNIVEDLALGLAFAERGHGPVLCDAARITGALPGADDAAVTQRTRWEHGYLSTLLTRSPALLVKGVFTLRPKLIAAAIDLAVPPLSLLVMGSVAALGLTAVIGWWAASPGPACLLAASLGLACLALLLAWATYGRSSLPIRAALGIPGYILWKLPIYARFLVRREKSWVRTGRDTATPGSPPPPAPPGSPGNSTSDG
jgi:cellulose synthase/poly-beta-1,6-N-acetylglucosamine synthase-like glycosyltransferase